MHFRCIAGVVALMLLAGIMASSQQPVTSAAVFRAGTNLVMCNASVWNEKHRPVLDLPKEAFTLYDNDVPQTIQVFTHEDVPVSLGLIIDDSAGMGDKRGRVVAAALTLVKESNPADEMFVVNFDEEAFLDLPNRLDFTSDPALIQQALSRVTASSGSFMRDAVAKAVVHVQKAHKQRKALVVVSNGIDTGSFISEEELLRKSEEGDATIYVVGLLNKANCEGPPGPVKRAMGKLADATGGEAFFPRSVSEVEEIAHQIARKIREQYLIGYKPPGEAAIGGQFRQVRLVVNGHKHWTVLTRDGYVTPARVQ